MARGGAYGERIAGPRFELTWDDERYPDILKDIPNPPKTLFALGDLGVLRSPGLAVVGARRATPYGIGCAKRFASLAAGRGVVVISGGARGCDAGAHEAAMAAGAPTVVVLGGGIDEPYPVEHAGLFQRVVNAGGLLLSEHAWGVPPLPYAFRERNRIIAGLARATLIVEAGLPSGTFSTADAALSQGREVLVIPGAITSANSRGANRLLHQGAHPIVDDESFEDALFGLFGCLKQETVRAGESEGASDGGKGKAVSLFEVRAAVELLGRPAHDALAAALSAEAFGMEGLLGILAGHAPAEEALPLLMIWLAEMQKAGAIAQYPDGTFGPVVRSPA
ncbi:MAG: DNA-processing protein DprA [Eggerthellaceae bacterium]|nr:DNA-processing protein DprA [Eggerthellaceae bacterium]